MKNPYRYGLVFPLLFLLVFITACGGQSNPTPVEGNQSPILPSPEADPQIGEYVVCTFEDKKGNLWFGTLGKGAARYDGNSLTYFSIQEGLVGDAVTIIVEDHAGNLWFGTQSGLSKYDGKTFTNFTNKDGLCNDMVSDILIDKEGGVWIGTWGGVCRYNGLNFSKFPLPIPELDVPTYQATTNWVTDIIEDREGNIWFGRSGYGAYKYDPVSGKFTGFTKKEGLPSNCVQAIMEDTKGNIWFGTRMAERDNPDPKKRRGAGGLSRFDGKTFQHFPDVEGLHHNDIYSIAEDQKGNIWIGATGLGVYCYDGKSFKIYKGTNRMDLTYSYGVQDILEDRNGQLWFGFSGGLFRLMGDSIVNVSVGGPWK
jgi:ligand-binding sensor domain-containing protein